MQLYNLATLIVSVSAGVEFTCPSTSVVETASQTTPQCQPQMTASATAATGLGVLEEKDEVMVSRWVFEQSAALLRSLVWQHEVRLDWCSTWLKLSMVEVRRYWSSTGMKRFRIG
jgi:hypothetical protein